MLFKPRGVTSNDPKYAGGSRLMPVADILVYRDTWCGAPPTEGFSLAQILGEARAANSKPVVQEKLVMSENGFKVKSRDSIDTLERGVRAVQAALNKLTESNFDVVVQTVLTPDIIINADVAKDVVRLIYEKALVEPVFAGLYARMCYAIVRFEYEYRSKMSKDVDTSCSTVRVAIVEKCQLMFNSAAKEAHQPMSEEQAEKLRKRNVNNIKFAGELFLKALITQKIIDRILDDRIYSIVPNDMELEVIINLLEVVGKLYEEKNPAAQGQLWKMLASMQENRRYSMRIRFLLQNLIDRRNGGWKPREAEQVVVEEPQPPQQTHTQPQAQSQSQNQQQQQQAQQPQKHYQQPQHYRQHEQQQGNAQPHGYHQHMQPPPRNPEHNQPTSTRRVSSYHDVSGALGVAGRCTQGPDDVPRCGSYHNMPPPSHGNPPEARLSMEERRRSNNELPPTVLVEEFQQRIILIARDAAEEDMVDPGGMMSRLKSLGRADSVFDMTDVSVYVILLRALKDSKESERKLFLTTLEKGGFERDSIARGFAWTLVKIITERYVVDCPRIYIRFVEAVWSIPTFNFICVTRDIMSRATNLLDALSAQYENENEGEWEEDFIIVWENLISAGQGRRPTERKPSVDDMMQSIGSIHFGPFMCSILADFVASMIQANFFEEGELIEWRERNKNNSKMYSLVEELAEIYP
uniref:Uncharacterized protein TCIL3000_11_11150 n=1 Tax=Trypanosoma congolense (strain IL3000) TaxID=1068625 RepID=G0V1V9_TRYCI|nr:unnamed protein product [Trypanosoma congolense IL3000]